jgi:uncharacterized membrane protein
MYREASMDLSTRRHFVRIAIGVLFIGAGLVHFTHASLFENLVPVALKDYRGSVNAVTGVLIFAMGVAFLVARLRAVARWSAIALLVVTLPTTAYRAIHPAPLETLGFPPALAPVGVVLWLLMIALIWWATRPEINDRNA